MARTDKRAQKAKARQKDLKKRQAKRKAAELGFDFARLANAPVAGTWRNADLYDERYGVVLLVRETSSGSTGWVAAVLDLACRGLVEASGRLRAGDGETEQLLGTLGKGAQMVEISEAEAKAAVFAAEEYGVSLGFELPGGWPSMRPMFARLEGAWDGAIPTGGPDGRPMAVVEDDEAAAPVLAHLEARLGPDGFTVVRSVGGRLQVPLDGGEDGDDGAGDDGPHGGDDDAGDPAGDDGEDAAQP